MTEALLVMDMQVGIVERLGAKAPSELSNARLALAAARSHDMPVIFVRVAFRDGTPEVSHNNKSFSSLSRAQSFGETDASTQIHPDLAPQRGEVVVTKRRVSAFAGSDLDVVLRSMSVDALVLTGIATSGVVLSTTRQAADLDFRITILRDACADADDEVHRVLMDKVFPRQATVMTTDEWISHVAGDSPEVWLKRETIDSDGLGVTTSWYAKGTPTASQPRGANGFRKS